MEDQNIKTPVKIQKTLKDGTIKIYTYDQSLYNKKFYEKHKEDILKKIVCPLCKGSYCERTYLTHIKSKKHLNFLN